MNIGKLRIKLSVLKKIKTKKKKINIFFLFIHIKKNYLKMKKKAEINIENDVIIVPAYFDSNQKDLIEKIEKS